MNAQAIAHAQGFTIRAPQNWSLDSAESVIITDIELPEATGTVQLITTKFHKAADFAIHELGIKPVIKASASCIYWGICCAINHDLEVYSDGVLIEIRTVNKKGEVVMKSARERAKIKALAPNTNAQFQDEFRYLRDSGLQLTPCKVPVDVIREELHGIAAAKPGYKLTLPNGQQVEASEAVDALLNDALEKREAFVKQFHTVSQNNPHATHIEVEDYAELRQMIIKAYEKGEKLTVLLNGKPGDGKTSENIDPIFDHFSTAGAYPLNVSARRSQAARFNEDKRHYWKAIADLRKAQGIAGVSNTIFHEQYDELTCKSKVLMIDEIEEERSHRTIGNKTIDAIAAYNERKEQQMKRSQIVITADANATDDTVQWLHEVTGQQVIVASKKTETQYFSVNYYRSKDQVIGEIKAQLKAGRNVALFCDAEKEKVRDWMSGLEKDVEGLKCKMIDGAFAATEDGREFLGDIDESSKQFQLLVITPVINSGVSIQNGHFDSVFVIAAHTVLPTGIMQALRRFRDVSELNLCFYGNYGERSTDAGAIMTSTLSSELKRHQFTLEAVNAKMEEKYPRMVVERMAWENRMRNDYNNTLLIMLEQQGYTINRIGVCEETKKSGTNTSNKGKRKEQKYRNEFLISAPVLAQKDVHEIKGKGNAVTREQALLLKSHEIRSGLGVAQITEDDIKFEEDDGVALVNNIIMTQSDSSEYMSAKAAFKAVLIQRIFEILGINTEDWSGQYSNYNGLQLREFIYNGEITVTTESKCKETKEVKCEKTGEVELKQVIKVVKEHNTLSARTAFNIAFGDTVDPAKRISDFIKSILAQFGLKSEAGAKQIKDPDGKRNLPYSVVKTDKHERAEFYVLLLTRKVFEIADRPASVTCRIKVDSILEREPAPVQKPTEGVVTSVQSSTADQQSSWSELKHLASKHKVPVGPKQPESPESKKLKRLEELKKLQNPVELKKQEVVADPENPSVMIAQPMIGELGFELDLSRIQSQSDIIGWDHNPKPENEESDSL